MSEAPPHCKRFLPFDVAPFATPAPPEAPPLSKRPRPQPLRENPISNPPTNRPPAFVNSPMINTPQGIILNPAFKAEWHTLSPGHQPHASHAPVPRPPTRVQGQTSFPHPHSQSFFPSGHTSPACLPYNSCGMNVMQSGAQGVQGSAPHAVTGVAGPTGSYVRYDPTARLPPLIPRPARSLDKPRIQIHGPNPNIHRPVGATPLAAGEEDKDKAALVHAKRLSSWCHVKHSRGETPELSRDQVKALVQVPVGCMFCIVTTKNQQEKRET